MLRELRAEDESCRLVRQPPHRDAAFASWHVYAGALRLLASN
jgi:hypothetical protein